MALKFGTSGVRGLVTELTDLEVYLFTWAFLKHAQSLGQNSPVAIAHDLRDSSPRIQDAAVRAISEFGRESIICGTIPTPALAFFAQSKKCLAIMITGSHIPADRNGIKFYLETGETLKSDDESIFSIYQDLKKNNSFTKSPQSSKPTSAVNEARDLYFQRYTSFFPQGLLSDLKVLFYQHSSVARDIYPRILENLGAKVVSVGYSDTFVPVDTEAIDAQERFREWIQEHQADVLVSTDGDADRPLVVDGLGNVIPGDKVGALASLYLNCEAIALPVSSNSGISKMPEFKKVVLTKIGSPFVVQALNELSEHFKTVGGFEANGGFLLQSNIQKNNQLLKALPTRDAVLPVLALLALAKRHSLKINEVTNLLPKIYTTSGLVKNFPTEKSLAILEKAAKSPESFFNSLPLKQKVNLIEVNTLDGLRCSFEDNITIHLRPSGNAPEFRCYIEAPSQKAADQICKDVLIAFDRLNQ